MEHWQSHVLAIALPLGPAAVFAYMLSSRALFFGAFAGALLAQTLFSPFVVAQFDGDATLRDRIISQTAIDLPYTIVGAGVVGFAAYVITRYEAGRHR
ncbi:MAG: hypothetical protein WD066_13580 [Planctomycetaceae bacterium]